MNIIFKRTLIILAIGLIACNNTREEKGFYKSGKMKFKVIYEENKGKKIKLEEYKFYENGKPEYSGQFKNNMRSGIWTYWYSNGHIWTTCEYQSGLKHGASHIYFKNGKIKIMGTYKDNKPNGTWLFYDETGNILKETHY